MSASTVRCPYCGQNHPAGMRFCPVTGKQIPEAAACPHCGAGIQQGWRTCPRCGRSLARGGARRAWLWVAAPLAALILLAALWLFREYRLPPPPAAPPPLTAEASAVSSAAEQPAASPTPPSEADYAPTPAQEALYSYDAEDYSAAPAATAPPTALPGDAPRGKIVFVCQLFKDAIRNQICLINADGSGWARLSQDDQADHVSPSFSPDGQSIVFALEKGEHHQIYEIDLAGNQRQLTDLPFGAYAPAISPDNRWIVFTANDGGRQTLWLVDRDGGNSRLLLRSESGDVFDPTWSPDGKRILFASNQAGSAQLFSIGLDGSDQRQITEIEGLRGRSDWSPDGSTIATYAGEAWRREIILIDPLSGEVAAITQGGNNLAPNYSPDGGWMVFTSYMDNYGNDNGCELYLMRLDGSQVTRLTENDYCDWQPNWGW
ncbi:MAG: zinc-ribbon domain-containing protein [Chloroflexi bacterium]|nr:zinc-ribbon domain-containing protein [Chloroflexota bacterium]